MSLLEIALDAVVEVALLSDLWCAGNIRACACLSAQELVDNEFECRRVDSLACYHLRIDRHAVDAWAAWTCKHKRGTISKIKQYIV